MNAKILVMTATLLASVYGAPAPKAEGAIGVFAAAPVAAAIPVPAPFVTAHSSQVIARNYNGLLAPYALPAAPLAAAPLAAAPLAAPLAHAPLAAAPLAAPLAPAPLAYSPYLASPYHYSYFL